MTEIQPIDLGQLSFWGHSLHRPECVLCASDGSVYTPDWRGGVTRIRPDGSVCDVHCELCPDLHPNSIALCRDGSFLLAALNDCDGGVWRLTPGGCPEPWLMELEGQPIPPTNFVFLDDLDRLWITVSTRHQPRATAYNSIVRDGFIICVPPNGKPRIVCDGIAYTNEVRVSPDGKYLYVVETFGRRISRYRITNIQGELSDRETVAEFGAGTFPDGIAFDCEGGLWVTSIISNRVIRLIDGRSQILLEDSDENYLEHVEKAFQSNTMGRAEMDAIQSRMLKSISSIAFGGKDRKTVYLGCLHGESLVSFRSPIAGLPLTHLKW